MANRIAHFNPSGFRNFPGYTIISKAILCCVSFTCNKMQNRIFELPEVRKFHLFLKGFQTGKRRWRDSRNIKCLNAKKQPIDYETNLSRACGNVWEMSMLHQSHRMFAVSCPARTGNAGSWRIMSSVIWCRKSGVAFTNHLHSIG